MMRCARRAVVVGVGGSALSALAVAGWTGREPPAGPAGPAARSSVRWMGLTTVAVSGATRWSTPTSRDHGGSGHDHSGRDAAGQHQVHAARAQTHGVWADTVLVELDLRNDSNQTVRISAGQFRLRVDSALTVSYYDAEQSATAVPPGRTVSTRIAYLVPAGAATVSLDFTPVGAPEPFGLPLHPIRSQVA